MDNDGNKITWSVIIIAAVASIGLMFVNFMPSQTANIKTAIGNELSSFVNSNKSNSSSSKSRSSSPMSSSHTAVGTNLLKGTHDDWQSTTAVDGWSVGHAITVNVEKNTDYTAQSEIKSDVNTDTWHIEVWGFNKTTTGHKILIQNQETHVNGGISQVTFNSGDYTHIEIHPHVSTTQSPKSKMVYWRHEKLEKGSNATDYIR